MMTYHAYLGKHLAERFPLEVFHRHEHGGIVIFHNIIVVVIYLR